MKTLKKVAVVLPILAFLLAPVVVGAQVDQNVDVPESPIESVSDLEQTLGDIIGIAQTFLFALAALFIIIAGYKYLTAAGNEDDIKDAKNMLIYALVAIVIGIIAGGVVNFVADILGA